MKRMAASQVRSFVVAMAGALAIASSVRAQVTGHWGTTYGGAWNVAANWSNSVTPNGVGDWAWLTGSSNWGGGFAGTPTITQNVDVTLGYAFLGDVDRGTAIRWESLTGNWLTFNTGAGSDGFRALLSHGSGDLHQPGVAGKHINIGNAGDWIGVGIRVADEDGLYISITTKT